MSSFDLVIKNGTLVDPEKSRVTVGNIGITRGKIAVITRQEITGEKEIDAGLKAVCPGFVDIHAHVDGYLYSAQCMVLQGVTTSVGGNCGMGPVELGEFFSGLEKRGFPLNQAMMIGHSFALREKVGAVDPYRGATTGQVEDMCRLAEEAFDQGAIGLSFGLEYAPGTTMEEILALGRVAARYGKLVAVHTRHDSWRGIGAIREALRITEITGAPLQISHLVYQVGMGMMSHSLEVIHRAIQDGLDVTVDSGMYHAFATFIGSPVFDDGCLEKWGCDYSDLYVATGKYAGQRCDRNIFQEMREKYGNEAVVAFACREKEVYQALEPGYVMVSTDGAVGAPVPGTGHPQDAGTYPRFFQKMVREQGRLSLVEAVRRCTYLPANRLGLKGKGRINVGADADLVVFDPAKITDRADYPGLGRPDESPEGIDCVVVTGEIVAKNGKIIENVLPGGPIRAEKELWRWV